MAKKEKDPISIVLVHTISEILRLYAFKLTNAHDNKTGKIKANIFYLIA